MWKARAKQDVKDFPLFWGKTSLIEVSKRLLQLNIFNQVKSKHRWENENRISVKGRDSSFSTQNVQFSANKTRQANSF